MNTYVYSVIRIYNLFKKKYKRIISKIVRLPVIRKRITVLKLIVPKRKNADTDLEKIDGRFYSILYGVKKYGSIMSSLPVVAAVTPKSIHIEIIDENIEEINFDERVDIVGITANTSIVERAYEIADEYRKRNIKVVIGGVHTSVFPEEGLFHSDSVVVGEAENIWPQVIRDFKQNNLRKIYSSEEKPALGSQPAPRYDLIKNSKYLYHTYQTARGCPYDCYFCSVPVHMGREYRSKPVNKIISEIKKLYRFDNRNKLIFFCDDNFIIDRCRTIEFLHALKPLEILYTIQARLDIYKDDELLEILFESGCLNILIGIDSVYQENIELMNKKCRVNSFSEAIKKIQSKGLFITGSFIFGFDNDGIGVFEDTVRFIRETGLGSCVLNILTPLPGTKLYSNLEKEDRIIHKNWTYYDCRHVCFKPKNMSVDELQNGYLWASQMIFDLDTLYERVMNIYDLWNQEGVMLHRLKWPGYRLYPFFTNLAAHDVAYFYPKAKNPKDN